MNLQEQLNRIQEMMGINPDNERKYIDWDENYGKTFKIVKTPEGRQSVGEWNPDLISIVTPENTDAWTDWEEISNKILRNWKQNWDDIQKSLGQHKYDQIIRSQKMLSEGLHDTSWENEDGDKITLIDLLNATEDIPVEEISVEELKPHLLSWDGNDEEIKKIEKADLNYPILIFVNDNDEFLTIIDGHHRAQKAARKGLETIKAKIIPINFLPKNIRKVFKHIK